MAIALGLALTHLQVGEGSALHPGERAHMPTRSCPCADGGLRRRARDLRPRADRRTNESRASSTRAMTNTRCGTRCGASWRGTRARCATLRLA